MERCRRRPGDARLGRPVAADGRWHPFLVEGRADVLAHRGASSLCPPGNIERAFAAALHMGFDHLETDVQATSDGVVRLDELLGKFPDALFNIDVKTDATIEPATRILIEADARDRVCAAAFGCRRLRTIRRRLGPGWCSAMAKPEIALTRTAARLRLPVPHLADVVQLPTTFRGTTIVDRRFVDACHRSDIAVHVWTVNDLGEAARLRALGVDAVISDRPDQVR